MQIQRNKVVKRYPFPFKYNGNFFFLIFFMVIWPPLSVLMFTRNGELHKNGKTLNIYYHGKWFWIYFFSFPCFFISYLLLFLRGIEVHEIHDNENDIIQK